MVFFSEWLNLVDALMGNVRKMIVRVHAFSVADVAGGGHLTGQAIVIGNYVIFISEFIVMKKIIVLMVMYILAARSVNGLSEIKLSFH
jgi:hypothetical protein